MSRLTSIRFFPPKISGPTRLKLKRKLEFQIVVAFACIFAKIQFGSVSFVYNTYNSR